MPLADHILVGIDFSERSQRALAAAKDLAERYDAKLTLLHVFDASLPRADAEGDDLQCSAATDDVLTKRLAEWCTEQAHLGDQARYDVIGSNDPAEAICDYAAKHGADMIVLATRGVGMLERILIGSVAEGVVRHAGCTVVTVR